MFGIYFLVAVAQGAGEAGVAVLILLMLVSAALGRQGYTIPKYRRRPRV